ncbi:hypothetical protein N7519_009236 [Penicillium mononematosum]|uniref:uncharacterized protein n=1 Tax=Penicillium mononematosum TaxID=268346 RepID=UPI002547B117|nr:uncharacterized protein N7519_009236 [Penicillium mononematosum]KAJ6178775.1 hypothetical protein N7519_009236 [Penicillium mononematosum]
MTTDALFAACSTTKAFTHAAISIAIQDSKATNFPIDWDTPVTSLIPEDFILENDYATKNITLEDALSHRNYTYIAVSHALEQHTGEKLGAFMKKRIWDPLGMNETFFSPSEAKANPSIAAKLVQAMTGQLTVVLVLFVSNVIDYAHWMRESIEKTGPLKGHDGLTDLRTIYFQNDDLNLPAPYHAYALGWVVHNYRGQHLYSHGGGWPGYASWVGFVREKKFGFVVMGNSSLARYAAFRLVTYLLDRRLGLSDDPKYEQQIAACIARQTET